MPRLLQLLCALVIGAPTLAADLAPQHAIAMHGEPRYAPDFSHFDYVNPQAPKGGRLRLAALGSFDSFNTFNLRGQPAAGLGNVYETLMRNSADEAFTEYGLLAESITVPEDRSWVAFTLRPEARFQDGAPVTVEDVIFSFQTLLDKGRPFFRFYYASVSDVRATGERTVRFDFKTEAQNKELPLILGQLPILPSHLWQEADFEAVTLDTPLGSGPYRLIDHEPGRYVEYALDPNYWGRDLPINRGHFNFERIRYDYYRDGTVALEAFKANDFDFRLENRAKDWASSYDVPAVRDGRIVLREFPHQRPAGMQGYVFNQRRALFQDPRVRRALAYAFDFEWSNTNLFHGQYARTHSYFENSELAATGEPLAEERALLEPLRGQLPPEVFGTAYTPPTAGDPLALRDNLRQALTLLGEAGWQVRDGRLRNAEGTPFDFEILLVSPAFEPITLPFVRNLERLGIEAQVRTVDSAQYTNRVRDFNFDVIVAVWGQSNSPGNEQRDFWGSAAADQPGSRNYAGLQDPAVDQLIEQLIAAPDRQALIQRTRALDRVLQRHYLVVPHWHVGFDRVAHWNRLAYPEHSPASGMATLLNVWWHRDAQTP